MSKRSSEKLLEDEVDALLSFTENTNVVKRMKITRQDPIEVLNDQTECEEGPLSRLQIKVQPPDCSDDEEEYVNYLDDELIEFMGKEDNLSLESSLGEWASSCNITLYAFNKLLKILRDYHPTLPESGKEIETFKRSGSPLGGLEGIEIGVENLQDSISSSLKNQRAMMKQIVMLKQNISQQQQQFQQQQEHRHSMPQPHTANKILSLKVTRMEDDLNLPCATSELFLQLDDKCREDPEIESKLRDLFLSSNDWEVKKFISKNLSTIFEDSCAQNFSWFGLNGKLTLKKSYILKLLYNVTQSRFSHVTDDNIKDIIKKWFHLAKDRVRKKATRVNK